MKKPLSLLSVTLLSVFFLSSAVPELDVSAATAEAFEVDLVHSSIIFRVKHANVSYAYGRFNEFSGEIQWSPEQLGDTSVSFEVKADSVDTNNEGRDEHLCGPDFFSCKEFPTWSFQSKKVEALGEDRYAVSGEMTMRGEKKDLRFEMDMTGEGEQRGTKKIGFETTFSIKRSEFGMDYGLKGIGDDVRVTMSIEANGAKG
ncbi:MAG: YceI family protein [Planctomycetota bacterium]|nr:YceI family protein [Planctomycetota bacterium]